MNTTIVNGLISSFGPYQVEALLGRGGMGEVYRAVDSRRGRTVALKVLAPAVAQDEQYRSRFRRESDNAARLTDPHVIPIHDFGEIDGRLYIDMRLVDGTGLDSVIEEGPLSAARAVSFVVQIADALADAHANGVVHRDVKPSNVLVTKSDFVYLVDFGIARAADDHEAGLTQTGMTVGTLAYMAPERFEGGRPDTRSDIYALACVLAECLTGQRPFQDTSAASLMRAHLVADPPRPSQVRSDAPRGLDDVIARGMAKDPADRYQTPTDLAIAAKQALRSAAPATVTAVPAPTVIETVGAAPATEVSPTPSRRAPRRNSLIAAAAALIVVAAGGGYLLGHGNSPGSPAPAAAAPGPAPIPRIAVPTLSPGNPQVPFKEKTKSLTYTVESNHPVTVSFTDHKGDQAMESNASSPWSKTIATDAWGKDQKPMLSVIGSQYGDTTVTCTMTDDRGEVVATDTKSSGSASASCYSFSY